MCVAIAADAQVSVTATAGTPGPTVYTTLKGAFDAINLGTHQGIITVNVTASTTETATASLNASGAGSASFTKVTIKPGTAAAPTITGAIASAPIIKLNGASNVTIDGSNNGTTSRNLTISNTSATSPQVLLLGSVGTTAITNDTLKNCTVTNGANTGNAVVVSDAATPGNAGYFTGIGIINNSVQKAAMAVYLRGVATGTNGTGAWVSGNDINATGANAIRNVGVYLEGVYGATVSGNSIGNFEAATAELDRGIWLTTGTSNTMVSNNTITGLSFTGAGAFAPIGIGVSPAVTAAAINITGNTITGLTSSGTVVTMGIHVNTAVSGITIQKNQISDIKNSNAGGYGAACILTASTLTAADCNIINNFVWDVAGYGGNNAWTANSSGNGIVIDGGGGYNIYFNTAWLNTNSQITGGMRSAGVLITTNVTTANSINLRNNLLINTQTVGNANSRMALAVPANANVLATFNYNDYYSTSTNLVGQGTNPTIWNTIAQVQTNMGGNGNSVNILPSFTSSTDLHLPLAGNAALNNLGVAIAAVTTDIDNDIRSTPPDMGADEFGNCAAVTITTQPAAVPVCDGGNASFTVAATNGNVIQWQVNTGSGFANITNNAVYGGATTGTLTITAATASMSGYTYKALVSSSSACPQTSSNTVTLTVNPLPLVAVSSSGPTTFCTGDSDVLSVATGANQSYQWKNGAGDIPGATAASYTATSSGGYFVTVTNTVTNCTATSSTTTITVGSGPAANVTPSGTVAICAGTTTTLSAGVTPGVTYQWKLNGNDIGGATAGTLTVTNAGSYSVTVSSSPTCASTSAATVVTVNAKPTAIATADGSTAICQGSTVVLNANTGTALSYQWLLNNAPIGGATASSYTVNAAGSYRVQVTNSTTTCKDSSAPIAVTVNPLPAATITPAAPAAICSGDTSLLSANTGAGLTYQWLYNAAPIAGATTSTYKAFAGGSYAVRVTNGNSCEKLSAAVPLTVNPLPTALVTYSSALQFCEGGGVVLGALPGAGLSYQWSRDGSNIGGAITSSYLVTESGQYTIRVVNTFNCAATSGPVDVTVHPAPAPVISYNGTLLSTGAYSTYQWFLNNIAIGGATASTHKPLENGGYKVMITDANGCPGTAAIFFLSNLAVGDLSGGSDVRVFPNPATAYVMVDSKGSVLRHVSLMNSVGAVVYAEAAGGTKCTVPTAALPGGIYYLRVQTSAGVLLKKVEIAR